MRIPCLNKYISVVISKNISDSCPLINATLNLIYYIHTVLKSINYEILEENMGSLSSSTNCLTWRNTAGSIATEILVWVELRLADI